MRRELPIHSIALAVSAALSVFFAVALAMVPDVGSRSIWKGYRVLAVPVETEEEEVVSRLSDAGIRDFATSSNSLIDNDSRMAPAQPFLAEKNAELSAWFIDAERGTRFLYLRDNPFLEDRVARAFSPPSFSWYLEGKTRTSALPAILFAAYLVVLGIFSSQRRTFLSAAIPFALFAAKCSDVFFFGAAAAAAYGIYLLSGLLEAEQTGLPRGHRAIRLKKSPLALAPLIISAALAAFSQSGFGGTFLLTLALSASFSVLSELCHEKLSAWRERTRLHPKFRPEYMSPDTLDRGNIGKRELFLSIPVPALLIASIFIFGFGVPQSGTQGDDRFRVLYIPSPSGYTSKSGFNVEGYISASESRGAEGIPDLAWFVAVRWNLDMAPWRRLDEKILDPAPGTVVKTTEYTLDANAKIRAEEKNRGTFDSSFIKKAVSDPGTPIEKLLVAQGRFVTVSPTRHER